MLSFLPPRWRALRCLSYNSGRTEGASSHLPGAMTHPCVAFPSFSAPFSSSLLLSGSHPTVKCSRSSLCPGIRCLGDPGEVISALFFSKWSDRVYTTSYTQLPRPTASDPSSYFVRRFMAKPLSFLWMWRGLGW